MITPCPKPLQYAALSTTMSPVTHTADVAVNSAVTNEAAPAAEFAG